MAFAYRSRLSARSRRIYDESDSIIGIELPEPKKLRRHLRDLERHLAADDRIPLQRACAAFVNDLLDQLEVPRVTLRVLTSRPRSKSGELYGEYVEEDGKRAVIRVWMRTAARKQPVAFRTFLRTVLHEICHHLDYHYLELKDSFHTQGFFQRESDLFKQLVPR